jgi:hypothetical protein
LGKIDAGDGRFGCGTANSNKENRVNGLQGVLILKLATDVVAFARTAVGLLNPRIWFDREKREKKWAELGRQTGVFKPAPRRQMSGR